LEPVFSVVRAPTVVTQRPSKQDSTAMNQHATIDEFRKRCFLNGPCQRVINGTNLEFTSPASRRRRRKGKCRIWDSKLWLRVPRDSGPRMTALAKASSNSERQTRPLAWETAPHQQTSNSLTVTRIWP
jgi:hypothetical protein